MILVNYSTEVTFECGPVDTNAAAFIEAASIIGGRDASEEILSYVMWPLSEKFGSRWRQRRAPCQRLRC
jgi:hypothetical protein